MIVISSCCATQLQMFLHGQSAISKLFNSILASSQLVFCSLKENKKACMVLRDYNRSSLRYRLKVWVGQTSKFNSVVKLRNTAPPLMQQLSSPPSPKKKLLLYGIWQRLSHLLLPTLMHKGTLAYLSFCQLDFVDKVPFCNRTQFINCTCGSKAVVTLYCSTTKA